jgi:hypothetical protein
MVVTKADTKQVGDWVKLSWCSAPKYLKKHLMQCGIIREIDTEIHECYRPMVVVQFIDGTKLKAKMRYFTYYEPTEEDIQQWSLTVMKS